MFRQVGLFVFDTFKSNHQNSNKKPKAYYIDIQLLIYHKLCMAKTIYK